jgi:hypothetical protein
VTTNYFAVLGVHAEAGRLFDANLSADWNVVSAHYFSTLRIAMLAGRDFDDRDTSRAPAVMIVSEEAARRYWPLQNPIGQTLMVHSTDIRRGEDAAPRIWWPRIRRTPAGHDGHLRRHGVCRRCTDT